MRDAIATPRAKARRITTRIGWRLGMRWYQFTSRFKAKDGHPVKVAASIAEIAARLQQGRLYELDPLNGKLDVLKHPRLVQRAIDEGRPLGDCDDHAGYWCSALLKSGLATDVYLATVQMVDDEGMSGHAFVLFQVEGDEWWYAADYGMPLSAGNPRTAIDAMASEFGARPMVGTWKRVVLRDDDGIRFVRGGGAEVWR